MKVANFSAPSKVCAIVLDEMTIKEGVSYNPSRDEVEGYEMSVVSGEQRSLQTMQLCSLSGGCKTSGNHLEDVCYVWFFTYVSSLLDHDIIKYMMIILSPLPRFLVVFLV